ncbi:hypothetical protein HZS_7393, partial [Henneguya salminicola]
MVDEEIDREEKITTSYCENVHNQENCDEEDTCSFQSISEDFNSNIKNKFLLLSQKIPHKYKPIVVLIVMVIVHLVLSIFPTVLRKYGTENKMDISFLCIFRCSIPTFILLIAAILIEGPFNSFPSLKNNIILLFFGLVNNGLYTFTNYNIAVLFGANYCLIYEQIVTIGISIASYFFKLEPLPTIKNKASILMLLGLTISLVTSISVIAINFHSESSNTTSKLNWI